MSIQAAVFVPFPAPAQAFLDGFYAEFELGPDKVDGRIKALRTKFKLDNIVVAADGGINSKEELLRALEFYVLQNEGLLDGEEYLSDEE